MTGKPKASQDRKLKAAAEKLYVERGLQCREIGRILDVPTRRVAGWCGNNSWSKKREKREKRFSDIESGLKQLREKLLGHALDTLEPDHVRAALAVEKAVREREPFAGDPELFLTFLEMLTEMLKERQPELVAYISDNFDALVSGFKERVRG